MKVVAILEVDEKTLAETGHSFEEEMGWIGQSGIHMVEYLEQKVEYEYASLLWNRRNSRYEQVNKAVFSESLCRNRLQEYIRNGWLNKDYDTSKVVIKRREIILYVSKWEELN